MATLMCRLMDNLCFGQLLISKLNHISNAKRQIAAEMKTKKLFPDLSNFHKFPWETVGKSRGQV